MGTGTLVGLVALAKASAPLWGLAAGCIMVIALLQARRHRNVKMLWVQALTAGVWSLFVFWAGYGFTWGKIDALPFAVPAPAYWKSSLYLTNYQSEVFALGQHLYGRWWWYFPLAFVLKNPLPLLLGTGAGLVTVWRQRRVDASFLVLLIFPALYALIAVSRGMNIGYRHMLPIHPFMYLLVGSAVTYESRLMSQVSRIKNHALRFTFYTVIFLWYILGALHFIPHELAYFNELVGGSENAHHYLADSNLDWGESAEMFAEYVEAHPEVHAEPPATKLRPEPGKYAIGASYLQGLGIGDPYAYAWFRQCEPQEVLYHNIFIYEVPAFTVHWIAQCGTLLFPLDEAALIAGLGDRAFRRTSFDCTQAWLYPDGGTMSGIYGLDRSLMQESRLCLPGLLPCVPAPDDPFIARHLTEARLPFDQDRKGELSAFVLYEASIGPHLPSATIYAVPVERAPETLSDDALAATPVILDGPLLYLGTTAYADPDGVDVETWWQVTAGPITRPFSIMAHLLTPQGDVIGMADGLGVWPTTLMTGDVFAQRHRFVLPESGDAVWLRTGAYWLDTMERWSIPIVDGVSDAIIVPGGVLPW